MTIAVVGKYIKHHDAYKSVYESLDHAGIATATPGASSARSRPRRSSARGPSASWAASTASWCRAASATAASTARSRRSASPASSRHPVLRHLPGPAVRRDRVRPQRARPGGRQQHRVRPQLPPPGRLPAGRAVRRSRDMGGTMRLGLVPVPAGRGQPGRSGLRQPTGPRAAPAPLRVQQPLPPAVRGPRHGRFRAPAPTASSSRSSSCRTTRGSWRCSATPSSSRSRRRRTRCSATSSRRAWRAARREEESRRRRTRTELPTKAPV